MRRFRTIPRAIEEVKRTDPETAISTWEVRQAVRSGKIPSTRAGRRYVIAVEDVLAYYDAKQGDYSIAGE